MLDLPLMNDALIVLSGVQGVVFETACGLTHAHGWRHEGDVLRVLDLWL